MSCIDQVLINCFTFLVSDYLHSKLISYQIFRLDITLLKRVWDLTIHETSPMLIPRPITNGYHLCYSCKVACFIFPTLFTKLLKVEKSRNISTDFKVPFIYYISTCGRSELKWIFRGHFKPPLKSTIYVHSV